MTNKKTMVALPSVTDYKPETYSVPVRCGNCGTETGIWEIPYGVLVDSFLQARPCPSCGCRTLRG